MSRNIVIMFEWRVFLFHIYTKPDMMIQMEQYKRTSHDKKVNFQLGNIDI